jgi:predicted GIY-YIG superfamily endonuclease
MGFSPRKAELVLYVLTGFAGQADLLARLGKHKTGKVCLYIKKLSDVDETVLEEIATRALAHMNEKYPATA